MSGNRRAGWLINATLTALMFVVLLGGLRLGGRWEYAFPVYILAVLVAGLLYAPHRIDNPASDTRLIVRVVYVLLAVIAAASVGLLLVGEVALGVLMLVGAAFVLLSLIRFEKRLRRSFSDSGGVFPPNPS